MSLVLFSDLLRDLVVYVGELCGFKSLIWRIWFWLILGKEQLQSFHGGDMLGLKIRICGILVISIYELYRLRRFGFGFGTCLRLRIWKMWLLIDIWKMKSWMSSIDKKILELMSSIWSIWVLLIHFKHQLGILIQEGIIGIWVGEYFTEIGNQLYSDLFCRVGAIKLLVMELQYHGIDRMRFVESIKIEWMLGFQGLIQTINGDLIGCGIRITPDSSNILGLCRWYDLDLHSLGRNKSRFKVLILTDYRGCRQIRVLRRMIWVRFLCRLGITVYIEVLGVSFSILISYSEFFLGTKKRGLGFFSLNIFCLKFVSVSYGVKMAQLGLAKARAEMVRTETVKISGSLMAQRIQQFSLTLIGRLMNPSCQRMESLVANMPKIWKLEEKVVGADLGFGKFQFNFQNEEDLLGVLQNVPYHFDGWMVSLVRWEPVIDNTYPCAINFWVKITGIPLHFWEESTIRAIGKVIGVIKEVDADSGSVYVTVNGFNPLMFKVVVPFDTGDEVVVSLEYDKLCGLCQHCFRLTHEAAVCPDLIKDIGIGREEHKDRRMGPGPSSNNQTLDGGWEKPRKPAAKRALEFSDTEGRDGFPYKRDGVDSRHYPRRPDKQPMVWGKKNGSTKGEYGSRTWSKPMKKLVIGGAVEQSKESVPKDLSGQKQEIVPSSELEMIQGVGNVELGEDGREEGELDADIIATADPEDNLEILVDSGIHRSDASEGTKAGAVGPVSKKGTVALPKPPADT